MPDINLDDCPLPQLEAMKRAVRIAIAAGQAAERAGIAFDASLNADATGVTISFTVDSETSA